MRERLGIGHWALGIWEPLRGCSHGLTIPRSHAPKVLKHFLGMVLLVAFVGCGGHSNGGTVSHDGKPVAFKPGSVTCPSCHMPVRHLQDSAEYIASDGKVTIFDDPGCMVIWLDKEGIDPGRADIWVYTRDTNRWIEAKKAHYSRTDATPMGYGFGAYEKPAKDRIAFEKMRLMVLQGLTLKDPKIRKKLLGY